MLSILFLLNFVVMKFRHYLVLSLLTLLWGWLSAYVFIKGGLNLKNILIVILSGWMIIFPVWKRYQAAKQQ